MKRNWLSLSLAMVLVPLGIGLTLATLGLSALAAASVALAALALGLTGTLWNKVLAGARGEGWLPLAQKGRRLWRRVRAALATVGPGIGRLRSD